MCKSDVMKRMSGIEESLLSMLEMETAKGLQGIDATEMGAVVDMVKDLGEAKYYCSIVMAMQEEEEPMGYNSRRYASGRFAPKGRGMGYDPMEDDMMGGGMGYNGSGGGSQGGSGGSRGGGQGGSGNQGGSGGSGGSQGGRSGYEQPFGNAYDRYQEARMGYRQQATAENRRMMEQTADEHMQEFEGTLREIWDEADQRQRNKIKGALVNMANGLK